jgi:hypothetical protein
MKDSGMKKLEKEMVVEYFYGLMAQCMKVTGERTRLMEEEESFTVIKTSTLESGKTTRPMDSENSFMQTEQLMRVNG